MALTARIAFKLLAEQTNPLDLGTPHFPLAVSFLDTLASGTANDQADVLFTDEITIASAANADIDFAGALTGAFGAAATFAKVKGLFIFTSTANTTRLTISRPASNGLVIFAAASDAVASLGPGAFFAVYDPGTNGICAVTAATGDLLNVANSSGASASYRLVIIGTSA